MENSLFQSCLYLCFLSPPTQFSKSGAFKNLQALKRKIRPETKGGCNRREASAWKLAQFFKMSTMISFETVIEITVGIFSRSQTSMFGLRTWAQNLFPLRPSRLRTRAQNLFN